MNADQVMIAIAATKKIMAGLDSAARAEVMNELTEGDRRTIRDDDGNKLGSITITEPKSEWKITDREKFEKWVQANRPEEWQEQISYRVNPAFEKAVLEHGTCKAEQWDLDTGEVTLHTVDVPGVEKVRRPGHPMVKVEPAALELARKSLLGELIELPW